MSGPFDPARRHGPRNRRGRMNRSRVIAAGTSVGALVALTAGVAAANPAPSNDSKQRTATSSDGARTSPSTGSSQGSGADSGWVGADDSGNGFSDPNSGWSDPNSGFVSPNQGFDPGFGSSGGGQSRSGGS